MRSMRRPSFTSVCRCSTSPKSKSSWSVTFRSSRTKRCAKMLLPSMEIVRSVMQESVNFKNLEPFKLIRSLAMPASWRSGYRRVCRIGKRTKLLRRPERGESLNLSTKKLKSTISWHLPRLTRRRKRSMMESHSSRKLLKTTTASAQRSRRKMPRELSLRAFKMVKVHP